MPPVVVGPLPFAHVPRVCRFHAVHVPDQYGGGDCAGKSRAADEAKSKHFPVLLLFQAVPAACYLFQCFYTLVDAVWAVTIHSVAHFAHGKFRMIVRRPAPQTFQMKPDVHCSFDFIRFLRLFLLPDALNILVFVIFRHHQQSSLSAVPYCIEKRFVIANMFFFPVNGDPYIERTMRRNPYPRAPA
jgi:hypothetical protein